MRILHRYSKCCSDVVTSCVGAPPPPVAFVGLRERPASPPRRPGTPVDSIVSESSDDDASSRGSVLNEDFDEAFRIEADLQVQDLEVA